MSREVYVADLMERGKERLSSYGLNELEDIRRNIQRLQEVVNNSGTRAFVLEPENGAESFRDFHFIFDNEEIKAQLPEIPAGHIFVTGAPIPAELADSLVNQLMQESGMRI